MSMRLKSSICLTQWQVVNSVPRCLSLPSAYMELLQEEIYRLPLSHLSPINYSSRSIPE